MSLLPGPMAFLQTLASVGMPLYPREDEDFGVKSTSLGSSGDFDPTPLSISGARRISTEEMKALVSANSKSVVLDFSLGGQAIPGAISLPYKNSPKDIRLALDKIGWGKQLPPNTVVVCMSEGPFGWASVDAARRLVAMGIQNVFWYPGGEAGWVMGDGLNPSHEQIGR